MSWPTVGTRCINIYISITPVDCTFRAHLGGGYLGSGEMGVLGLLGVGLPRKVGGAAF